MTEWFKKRYDIGKKKTAAGDGDPKMLIIAVVREVEAMTIQEQIASFERIEGNIRKLKIIKPVIKDDTTYEENIVGCWMKLVQAVSQYSGIIYVAHPDVISKDQTLLTSVLRTGVGMGTAIMVLK